MQEILKYQEIDLKIKKIESDIAGSNARANAVKMQDMLKKLQEHMGKLDNVAQTVTDRFQSVKKAYTEAVLKLEQVQKGLLKASGDKTVELLEATKAVQSGVIKLEREISFLIKQSDEINRELENVIKNAGIAKKNLMTYKDQYEKVKESYAEELAKLKSELAIQEKKVEKTLLSKYNSKQTGKIQVFVKLNSGRCGGCRMELASASIAKLASKGYMECENCGRILYN